MRNLTDKDLVFTEALLNSLSPFIFGRVILDPGAPIVVIHLRCHCNEVYG